MTAGAEAGSAMPARSNATSRSTRVKLRAMSWTVVALLTVRLRVLALAHRFVPQLQDAPSSLARCQFLHRSVARRGIVYELGHLDGQFSLTRVAQAERTVLGHRIPS